MAPALTWMAQMNKKLITRAHWHEERSCLRLRQCRRHILMKRGCPLWVEAE